MQVMTMKEQIKWTANRMPKSEDKNLELMSLANVAKARFFHSSFPQYSITPLARLDGMAKYLGLGGLFVKDEFRPQRLQGAGRLLRHGPLHRQGDGPGRQRDDL